MRTPWVRRRALDAATETVRTLETANATLTRERDDARQGAMLANEALSKLLAQHDIAARVAQERSELTRAIRDLSRGADGRIDSRLVGYFRGRANELLNQNMAMKEVIAQLGEWQTTETGTFGLTSDAMVDAAARDA